MPVAAAASPLAGVPIIATVNLCAGSKCRGRGCPAAGPRAGPAPALPGRAGAFPVMAGELKLQAQLESAYLRVAQQDCRTFRPSQWSEEECSCPNQTLEPGRVWATAIAASSPTSRPRARWSSPPASARHSAPDRPALCPAGQRHLGAAGKPPGARRREERDENYTRSASSGSDLQIRGFPVVGPPKQCCRMRLAVKQRQHGTILVVETEEQP